MSGGVEGLFLVISHTFPIYKQLSTQGTITSCSLNKLHVKNHWVLRDLENPQALSSDLSALRRYSPGPSSFLNPVELWFLTSNYYIDQEWGTDLDGCQKLMYNVLFLSGLHL